MSDHPQFYRYYENPYKIVQADNGGIRGYWLNHWTGEFKVANSRLREIYFDIGGDIFRKSEGEFIDLTEEVRAYCLRGDAGVFSIYEIIEGLLEQARTKGIPDGRKEFTLVKALRMQTFQLWEEEFANRAAGQPPTFEYTSVTGRSLDDLRKHDPTPDVTAAEYAQWMRELAPTRARFDQAYRDSL